MILFYIEDACLFSIHIIIIMECHYCHVQLLHVTTQVAQRS